MQIVIDIREDFLYEIKHKHPNMRTELEQSVLDGTILPSGEALPDPEERKAKTDDREQLEGQVSIEDYFNQTEEDTDGKTEKDL